MTSRRRNNLLQFAASCDGWVNAVHRGEWCDGDYRAISARCAKLHEPSINLCHGTLRNLPSVLLHRSDPDQHDAVIAQGVEHSCVVVWDSRGVSRKDEVVYATFYEDDWIDACLRGPGGDLRGCFSALSEIDERRVGKRLLDDAVAKNRNLLIATRAEAKQCQR